MRDGAIPPTSRKFVPISLRYWRFPRRPLVNGSVEGSNPSSTRHHQHPGVRTPSAVYIARAPSRRRRARAPGVRALPLSGGGLTYACASRYIATDRSGLAIGPAHRAATRALFDELKRTERTHPIRRDHHSARIVGPGVLAPRDRCAARGRWCIGICKALKLLDGRTLRLGREPQRPHPGTAIRRPDVAARARLHGGGSRARGRGRVVHAPASPTALASGIIVPGRAAPVASGDRSSQYHDRERRADRSFVDDLHRLTIARVGQAYRSSSGRACHLTACGGRGTPRPPRGPRARPRRTSGARAPAPPAR